MSELYLLDTNVVVHYVRRGEVARRVEGAYHLLMTLRIAR